ncbi:MAG: hypothetical protein WCA64_07835 [Gallionella sp.]
MLTSEMVYNIPLINEGETQTISLFFAEDQAVTFSATPYPNNNRKYPNDYDAVVELAQGSVTRKKSGGVTRTVSVTNKSVYSIDGRPQSAPVMVDVYAIFSYDQNTNIAKPNIPLTSRATPKKPGG